nr:transient-receptor-potential-like protein [Lepeophtheirus salmonis]
MSWFIRESQIPVNRFIYWELSKFIFYIIVLMTLVDDQEVAWYDLLAVLWIISYLLENFRTIHRLYRYGGTSNRSMVFKRWWTFRNIYILATDIIFLTALILRSLAYFNHQCRRGCTYEGNEVAFIAASLWSVACLLTFLRSIQGGLMWRQTGPIIISMSYMILDVAVFLFIFVIVYISFTLCTVYVYDGYDNGRTDYFHKHKMAFKLFFWAMIRTGNPQYADIRKYNSSDQHFDSVCLTHVAQVNSSVSLHDLSVCVTDPTNGIEEGISYIAGNSLWALYQFTVVIVLLSILRARMVNTYHRIFKEADVQWKYFRASIWWKYLDKDSALPPPFTLLFFCQTLVRYLSARYKKMHELSIPNSPKSKCFSLAVAEDKKEFEKRYRRLMLVLISLYHDNDES